MTTIYRKITCCLCLFFLVLSSVRIEAAHVVEKHITLTPTGPTIIRGVIAPSEEDARTFTVSRGKEARITILKGRRKVVYDVYDGQNIAANEGVAEGDWFPVSAGSYRITVNNVTGLEKKSAARPAPYEIRIEIR
ncbi:MAG TPA: hypothetical protein VIH45_12060 [Desulfuromonadaceae bacterium]